LVNIYQAVQAARSRIPEDSNRVFLEVTFHYSQRRTHHNSARAKDRRVIQKQIQFSVISVVYLKKSSENTGSNNRLAMNKEMEIMWIKEIAA
jgi:hypothetical protein